MIGLIFTSKEVASSNMASFIIKEYGFEKHGKKPVYSSKEKGVQMYDVETSEIVRAEIVDSFDLEVAYFLCRHRSAVGVGAFTVHSLGNWKASADVGGKPSELSWAAPIEMHSVLLNILKIN